VENASHLGSDQAAVEALAFLAHQTGLDLETSGRRKLDGIWLRPGSWLRQWP
jgi:hypothetical protein